MIEETTRIRYAEGSQSIAITLIHSWDRGEIAPISGGSGLKDYIKNQVWTLFEARKDVDRIVMVRGGGPVFLLMRSGGCWFDAIGKQVVKVSA